MSSSRAMTLPPLLLLLLAAAAPPLLRAQDLPGHWSTDHGNSRNSGNVGVPGPTVTLGVCRKEVLQEDPLNASQPARFYAPGVSSYGNNWLLFADSSNTYSQVLGLAPGASVPIERYTTDLSAYFALNRTGWPYPYPAAPYGVVASPAVVNSNATGYSEIYVASSDGFLYALNLLGCYNSPWPSCGKWVRPIGDAGAPSYSPPRAAEPNIVLVSETDANLDNSGVLHAYNRTDGSVLWSYETRYEGSWYGLKGVAPAVHPTAPVVFLAFGPCLVALGLAKGDVLSTIDTNVMPGGGDPFVSSVTLSSRGNAAYVHSSSGTLWRFNVLVDPGTGSVSMNLQWYCRYIIGSIVCNIPTLVEPAVDGGFYQPTTRAQRDELHALISQRHAARFGAAAADAGLGAAVAAAEAKWPSLRAARLAKELPRAELLALVTPSGYSRLRSSGRAARPGDRDDFGFGVYPFATPSLTSDDSAVAMADFMASQDSALKLISTASGDPIWQFDQFSVTTSDGRLVSIPFGKSRSSAAVDSAGFVFVASDVDWDDNPTDDDTLPVLFCLSTTGALVWATRMGEERLATIGSSSPMVTAGSAEDMYDRRAFMASSDNIVLITEGLSCPTRDPVLECSGHGACNCTTGACTCTAGPCFTGPDCGQFNTGAACGPGGTCDVVAQQCVCADACLALGPDGTCSAPLSCGPGGTCTAGVCACADPCWAPGPSGRCDQHYNCGPSGVCSDDAGRGLPSCTCFGCAALDGFGNCTAVKDCGMFATGCPSSGPLFGWDESGGDSGLVYLNDDDTYAQCWGLCEESPGCVAWSYQAAAPKYCKLEDRGGIPTCELKSTATGNFVPNACKIVGTPGPEGGAGGACQCESCAVLDASGRCTVPPSCGNGVCDGLLPGACACDLCFGPSDTSPIGACTVPTDCGPHGHCSTADGSCICDNCWVVGADAKCSVPLDCGAEGTCSPALGACTCTPCYSVGADAKCSVLNTCSGKGTCSAGECTCAANSCGTGQSCSDPVACGAGAIGPCVPGAGCACDACWAQDGAGACSLQNLCSGHGQCAGGQCTCSSACYSGNSCATVNTCSGRGTCAPASGQCACAPGYGASSSCATCDDCHSGPSCSASTDAVRCSGNGVCTVSTNGSFAGCVCAGGFSGPDCSVAPGSNSAAGAPAVSPGVAAGASVGALALLACFAYFLRNGWGSSGGGKSASGSFSSLSSSSSSSSTSASVSLSVGASAVATQQALASSASRLASLAAAPARPAAAPVMSEKVGLLAGARGGRGAKPVLR